MLRYLNVEENKNVRILPVSADTKRGAPVVIDYANDEIDAATAVNGIGLLDIAPNYNGINSVIAPNDTSFETIKEDSYGLVVTPRVCEKYATTELTKGTLQKGNYIKASSGKFVTGASGDVCEWIYGGEYSDPTGLTMYSVGRVSPKTVVTYTVSYNKNNATATGTTTDTVSPYQNESTVITLSGGFTYTGYHLLKWNTAADGSGTDYEIGDTFIISENATLYAVWEQDEA